MSELYHVDTLRMAPLEQVDVFFRSMVVGYSMLNNFKDKFDPTVLMG